MKNTTIILTIFKTARKQNSIILNIQRACVACIDIAMHVVAEKKLGIPQASRDPFDLLAKNKLITEDTASKMKAMAGFRNIVLHDYQDIHLDIVKAIIEKHLTDYKDFTKQILDLKH